MMIRRMAVLSNLPLWLLLACLMIPLCGCADERPPASINHAHLADYRLVPPDLFWTLSDGARMPVRDWLPRDRPARAVALALHGMNDSRDGWEISGPALAAAGIAVYAPDQRGFGQAPDRGFWPGADRLISDAAEMTRLAARTHPGAPVFVMGESMGGAVAMGLAARPDHPPVAGFVLLAPAVWSRAEISPLLTAALWTTATFAPNWKLTGRTLPIHILASDNIAALYRLSYDPLTLKATRASSLRGLVDLMTRAAAAAPHMSGRILIAYGANDQLVPPRAMASVWERLPAGARRAFYDHGYHLLMRDVDRERVIGDVVSWMTDADARLPSGAGVAAAAWMAAGSWQTHVPLLLPANLDDLAGGG